MARFCIECGAQIKDTSKFCPVCGTEAAALDAEPQQQKPPQQPQYQQQYASAPVKKKKTGLIIIIIILVFLILAGVGAAVVINLMAGNNDETDFFKIGKDQVPSVQYILGEKRDITSVSSSISNGVSEKVIQYKVGSDQKSDMYAYALALVSDYGYAPVNDSDFTRSTGVNCLFAAESAQKGYVVTVRIDYDLSGYTLTIRRGTGTLTFPD